MSAILRSRPIILSVLLVLLQKVENRVRIPSDLRELASAECLDSFTLIYTNILEHQADCPVVISLNKSFINHVAITV